MNFGILRKARKGEDEAEQRRIEWWKKNCGMGRIMDIWSMGNETHIYSIEAGDSFHYVVREKDNGEMTLGEK